MMKVFNFCGLVVCLVLFASCNNVDNSDKQANKNNLLDTTSESDAQIYNEIANDEKGERPFLKSHYDDSWWQVTKEYQEIADSLKEKGYYIDSQHFDGVSEGFKLSIRDDGREYETSLEESFLAVFNANWAINDEIIKKSMRLMILPKDEIHFKENLQKLFAEAIALRPDFKSAFFKTRKDVEAIEARLQLYSSDLCIVPKGFNLEIISNDDGANMVSEDCDRLFIVTAGNKDTQNEQAKIVFAYLYEAIN